MGLGLCCVMFLYHGRTNRDPAKLVGQRNGWYTPGKLFISSLLSRFPCAGALDLGAVPLVDGWIKAVWSCAATCGLHGVGAL